MDGRRRSLGVKGCETEAGRDHVNDLRVPDIETLFEYRVAHRDADLLDQHGITGAVRGGRQRECCPHLIPLWVSTDTHRGI